VEKDWGGGKQVKRLAGKQRRLPHSHHDGLGTFFVL